MYLEPLIFIFGPSGVGKSTLGNWLAEDLGFLHLEVDCHPQDGIDLAGIRNEWEEFCSKLDGQPLCRLLRERIRSAELRAMVVSFPSTVCFNKVFMEVLRNNKVTPLILLGSKQNCIDSFLRREASTGRGLDIEHWLRYNSNYDNFASDDLSEFRLWTFENHRRISRNKLIAEVRKRMGYKSWLPLSRLFELCSDFMRNIDRHS